MNPNQYIAIDIPLIGEMITLYDGLKSLRYALAGVFDVEHALQNQPYDTVIDFINNGHPRHQVKQGNFIVPGYVQSVQPSNYSNKTPFGVFFATSDLNPVCNRPLPPSSFIDEYRQKYPVIQFNSTWIDWSGAANQFIR